MAISMSPCSDVRLILSGLRDLQRTEHIFFLKKFIIVLCKEKRFPVYKRLTELSIVCICKKRKSRTLNNLALAETETNPN